MKHDGDEILVARARRGDETAFARLVERHYGLIFRVAWRWCGDRSDAEDIAQDVCIKLARVIGSFRGEAAFTTWLTRLTINAAKDAIRARARRTRDVTALAFVSEGDLAEAPAAGMEDETAALWQAVHALPARQRDAMLLVYAEGMKHAEAAKVLGCRESTLSWHVHEARKTLHKQLREVCDG
jgi:RNA polymerase sigma-70 factor (ECF subfamily)